MKIEDLEKLKDFLSAYKTEKCKEYKNDKHYNVYLDISCSDCPAKDLIFSNDGDFIGSNCMMSILIKNIADEIKYYGGFSSVEIQESEDGD